MLILALLHFVSGVSNPSTSYITPCIQLNTDLEIMFRIRAKPIRRRWLH